MTLRTKILGFISAMVIALIIILYACVKIIVLSNSADIELQIANNDALRVKNFILYEIERTTGINQTLSEWDESIDFVNGRAPDYEEDNLMESAYISMQLESIVFLNSEGNIVYEGAYDLNQKQKIPSPPGMKDFIEKYKHDWLKLEAKQAITGMERIDDQLLLYSARPIVDSKGMGDSNGVVITGKFFDTDEITIMNNILKTKIEMELINDDSYQIIDDNIIIKQISSNSQTASFIVRDNEGKPIAMIISYADRFIYKYGQNNLHYFIISIIFICVIICLVIIWLLDKNVLSKIERIIYTIEEIEKTNNISLRINEQKIDSDDELGKLSFTINSMLDTLEKSRDNLEYLSMHDSLTGLYNRAKFEQGMESIKKNNIICVSIMICDVDGLKQINDNRGHKEGDRLLVTVANILKKCFREDDKIYRIGGDEFAAILESNNTEFINSIYERINNAIKAYNDRNPNSPISVSIGFAYSDKDCCDVDHLFKEADNNMYKEKAEHHK